MNLAGSKTEENLKSAFAGECQASIKYSYYASAARKNGYEQIAAIFEESAGNEKEHAKVWFKLLHDGEVPGTKENLADAAEGEGYEWTEMYKAFAEAAKTEGFGKIAALFEGVADIEKAHEERFSRLLENINRGLVFSQSDMTIWKCRNCGHIHIGKTPPEICPVCSHPQAFFEIKVENY